MLAVGCDQGQRHRHRFPRELKGNPELCGLKVLRQICCDDIIPNPVRRPVQKIDIPEDPGKAELVLVLKVGAVAPLEYKHGQKIVPFLEKIRYIELRRVMGHLAVSHIAPVEPDIETGVHPLKIQECTRRIGVPVPCEIVKVGTAGIVLRHIGRIKRKRITYVGVLGTVVSFELPAERHSLLLPPLAGLVVRQEKEIPQVMNARIKGKAPRTSAQHLQPVGALPVPDRHVIAGRARNIVSSVRQSISVQYREIFIESWYDQNSNPPFILSDICTTCSN